jgi:phage portal protein BeeE
VSLWHDIRRARGAGRSLSTIEDYAAALGSFGFAGLDYSYGYGSTSAHQAPVQQTMPGIRAEPIPNDFTGLAREALKRNGVIFACMLVRMAVFSAPRFVFQRFNNGRPSELFGSRDLRLLETPWRGGTTQDLLARLIQDADLAGNSYWTVSGGELVRLRPDWVQIILEPRTVPGLPDPDTGAPRSATLGWRRVGYVYYDDGPSSGSTPVFLRLDQVAHFAPIPDPEATYRGMSWLTPVIREVQADALMTRHKMKFFENGATPNMVVKHPPAASPETIRRVRDVLNENHAGIDNAYKTLHIGGGADVTVVGADLRKVEMSVTQGHGETRIAAAAGVPPVIVGLSEGLAAATYSNYGQARRRLADGTMHPLWGNAAGSFSTIVPPPDQGSRLWYDSRDVPFLREDSKDASEIAFKQAQTMRQLVDAGYTPESVSKAVLSGDFGLLQHSGLYSVQLQPAGASNTPPMQQED